MKTRIIFFPKFVEIDVIDGVYFVRNNLSENFQRAAKILPGVYFLSGFDNNLSTTRKK